MNEAEQKYVDDDIYLPIELVPKDVSYEVWKKHTPYCVRYPRTSMDIIYLLTYTNILLILWIIFK